MSVSVSVSVPWNSTIRTARHHALNELVARAMVSAVSQSDWKRPDGDGLSLMVPWKAEKSRTWDVTVVCPLADSYITRPLSRI